MLKLIPMTAIVIAGTFSTPAFSADMIGYYDRPMVQKHHHYRVAKPIYVKARYCEELLIDYRYPNQPRKEVVAVCARPPF